MKATWWEVLIAIATGLLYGLIIGYGFKYYMIHRHSTEMSNGSSNTDSIRRDPNIRFDRSYFDRLQSARSSSSGSQADEAPPIYRSNDRIDAGSPSGSARSDEAPPPYRRSDASIVYRVNDESIQINRIPPRD